MQNKAIPPQSESTFLVPARTTERHPRFLESWIHLGCARVVTPSTRCRRCWDAVGTYQSFVSEQIKGTSYVTRLYRFINIWYVNDINVTYLFEFFSMGRIQHIFCSYLYLQTYLRTVYATDTPLPRELLHRSRQELTATWKTRHGAMRGAGIKNAAVFSDENGLSPTQGIGTRAQAWTASWQLYSTSDHRLALDHFWLAHDPSGDLCGRMLCFPEQPCAVSLAVRIPNLLLKNLPCPQQARLFDFLSLSVSIGKRLQQFCKAVKEEPSFKGRDGSKMVPLRSSSKDKFGPRSTCRDLNHRDLDQPTQRVQSAKTTHVNYRDPPRRAGGVWARPPGSALTTTRVGTHIARFIPGEPKEGCGLSTHFTYRRTGVQSSRHTRGRLYLTKQVMRSRQVLPTWPWGGHVPAEHPSILHLESVQLLERSRVRQKEEKHPWTHPCGCAKKQKWLPVHRLTVLHTFSRARGESELTQWESSSLVL